MRTLSTVVVFCIFVIHQPNGIAANDDKVSLRAVPGTVSGTNLCRPLTAPNHGTIHCAPGFPFYTCNATCDPGYVFPNGKTSDSHDCDQIFGEWFDPPGDKLPHCLKTSVPGTVPGTNLCRPLTAPNYGTIHCAPGFPFYTCNATCDPGYAFPNGKTSDARNCDQMFGDWFDPPGEKLPHCEKHDISVIG